MWKGQVTCPRAKSVTSAHSGQETGVSELLASQLLRNGPLTVCHARQLASPGCGGLRLQEGEWLQEGQRALFVGHRILKLDTAIANRPW